MDWISLLLLIGRNISIVLYMYIDVERQKNVQNDLLRWLNAVGPASWKEINQAMIGMLLSQGIINDSEEWKYPAYKWFEPLLRNGVVEICRDKQVKFYPVFKELDDVVPSDTLSTLSMLQKIPPIKSQIANFEMRSQYLKKYFFWNPNADTKKYPNKFVPQKSDDLFVGIFCRTGASWEPKYLFDGESTRLIPWMDENPDALNLARCFVRINQPKINRLFRYDPKCKTLEIYHYEEHPILVTRALFLSDLNQVRNLEYYRPVGSVDNKIAYNNITQQHIDALKRIYNPSAIEEKND